MIHVIGAGLAGCEAAWQAAKQNIHVRLYEMKPFKYSAAHSSESFAELVCSNSFKASGIETAAGLLKEEMRVYGSLILECADKSCVPAGGALAVDRNIFSRLVTERICDNEYIEIHKGEIKSLGELVFSDSDSGSDSGKDIIIIATGPLTSQDLASEIAALCGRVSLSFFDAAAPVVYADSINYDKVYKAARYGKGSDDYINCPMRRLEYIEFYNALISAQRAEVENFDNLQLYEGCMPLESMAQRGIDTLRFGPLKPVGLRHPETGEEYYAVVQLRQDDMEGRLYNIVGFQTRLKFSEQKRVFGMIPGLEHAEYARYGVMHRNTYIHAPGLLNANYRVISGDNQHCRPIYFAGQITGVEGYIESTSSGLVAGVSAARESRGMERVDFTSDTAIGALAHYAAGYKGNDYQPMGINFGIINYGSDPAIAAIRNKQQKRSMISRSALRRAEDIKTIIDEGCVV